MLERKAFTLIELLVVIAIIGILSGLIVVTMSGTIVKARISKAQIFGNSLRNAIVLNTEGNWSLDGTPDDVWNHVTGTTTGSPTAATDCAQNSCYAFSGTGQYMTTPNTGGQYTIGTNPMTAMVWVKGASQVGKAFFANWDNTAAYKGAWKISSAANGTSFRVTLADTTTQANTKDYTTNGTVLDSTWHLVGFSWTGGSGTLTTYIDGVIDSTGTSANGGTGVVANMNANGTASAPISIACDETSGVASNLFTGSLDDARLFNAAVPTGQIKELYFAGLKNLFASGKMSAEEYSQKLSEVGSK